MVVVVVALKLMVVLVRRRQCLHQRIERHHSHTTAANANTHHRHHRTPVFASALVVCRGVCIFSNIQQINKILKFHEHRAGHEKNRNHVRTVLGG